MKWTNNKTILITGATNGIGKKLTQIFQSIVSFVIFLFKTLFGNVLIKLKMTLKQ